MKLSAFLRRTPLLAFGVFVACGKDGGGPTGPSNGPPAHLTTLSSAASAPAGTAVPGGITVKVTDANDRPVLGATVGFTVIAGNGTINPRVAVTDSSGNASTAWTLGTVAGVNQLSATVTGLTTLTFSATGTGGPVSSITLTLPSTRLLPAMDTVRITARSVDVFGNVTTPAPTFVVRDPSLLSVDSDGLVHALRRGASTYVVATAGGKSDSVSITVLAQGQSICTGVANPLELGIGQVVTDIAATGVCIHASSANAEYALVPYFNAASSGATTGIDVKGLGLTSLPLPTTSIATNRIAVQPGPTLVPDYAFESRLRASERREMPAHLAGARAWYAAQHAARPGISASVAPVLPKIGDLLTLNANATTFCTLPDYRIGRVVAITDKAIIVADTANPAGGFTDDEYRSIGVTFDTLVDPVDRASFGAPSDIDNNGHVLMFFTRAVNEQTASGASSVTLGFFYQRDLLPKAATPPLTVTPCEGSNVAEMFYLMVPDTGGVVNGNVRKKADVVRYTNGTVAHEYQHLINASRRMYINGSTTATEERWLDEGLSHIAEELNFYKSSGKSARTNIGAEVFDQSNPTLANAYGTFERNNVERYKLYLGRTETQGPIGSDPDDDDLYTRGAIWDFLRYAADQRAATNENAFWYGLVNTSKAGLSNLGSALGSASLPGLLRDWAISVFVDDNAQNADPRFVQPSWNLRAIATSPAFPLFTRTLSDGTTTSVTLVASGTSFLRFSVPSGGDALLTATSGGQPVPSAVMLSVVRVR